MTIVSSLQPLCEEEISLIVNPILEKGLSNPVWLNNNFRQWFISQRFDYLKIVSNPYSTWFNIEPLELQHALMNTSLQMGDKYIYLSFISNAKSEKPNTPLHFKCPIEDFLKLESFVMKDDADEIAKTFFYDVTFYSPQGLWAIHLHMDCYGNLGMTKEFLSLLRNIYPQLDSELDQQLFKFISWYVGETITPEIWKMSPENILRSDDWVKGLIEYSCKRKISYFEKNPIDVDIIDIYRNIKI